MKILITEDIHPVFITLLQASGHQCDVRDDLVNQVQLKSTLAGYDCLLVRSKFKIDSDLLNEAKQLKIIARAGAGLDNIDEEFCKAKNIILLNAPEGNRDAVAEHVIGLLLGLIRKIPKGNLEVKNSIWNRENNRGTELSGKSIGIIGYGNVGKALAKKLSGFDVNCIAYDKYLSGFSDDYCKEVSIKELQKQSDILSIHIPLSSETSHMIDAAFLNDFSKSIILINTARGKVIKTSDLVIALETGKVLRAGLDVLENENIKSLTSSERESFNTLITNENVILSSHIAGWTEESYYKIAKVLAEKIISFNKLLIC